MFHFRSDHTPFRVVGIDPGTDTLGVACLELDLEEQRIGLADARTFHGSRMLGPRQSLMGVHGSRFARLDGLEEALVDYFYQAQPHAVCSESPYLNKRFPTTFAALTESLTSIRRALIRYDDRIPLHTVDPAKAKAALGVSGKSGDKLLVQRAVEALNLPNPNGVDYRLLDEHSFDAIAIGHFEINRWLDRC